MPSALGVCSQNYLVGSAPNPSSTVTFACCRSRLANRFLSISVSASVGPVTLERAFRTALTCRNVASSHNSRIPEAFSDERHLPYVVTVMHREHGYFVS